MKQKFCDNATKKGFKISKNINLDKYKKVAIIGGESPGLECAGSLAREGVKVTIQKKHSGISGNSNTWHSRI